MRDYTLDSSECNDLKIGQSPIIYFISGVLLLFIQIALFSVLKRSRYLASHGDKFASSVLVLPIYSLIVYYLLTVGALVGLNHVLGFFVDNVVTVSIKWFLYRLCAEFLAVFLMHNGIGYQSYRRSFLIGLAWSLISTTIPLVCFLFLGIQLYVIVSIVLISILFTFYAAVVVLPDSLLPRRPAMNTYAIIFAIGLLILLAAHILLLIDSKDSPCVIAAIFAFGDLFQPVIIYNALREDSLFWQGLYVSTNQNNINEPLVGMWELGRDTIGGLITSMTTLSNNLVPIIPFGIIQIDSSRFFAGGSARVYRGKFKQEDVAVKILFCIELTPERVLSFCSEVNTLYSLQHENIVKCHGVCVMPPAICLVTEFCHHGSLYDFLHKSDFIIRDSVVSSQSLSKPFRGSSRNSSVASFLRFSRRESNSNKECEQLEIQDVPSISAKIGVQLRAHSIDDADFSSPDRSTSQTMRASTGTLLTADKLSEQELKKLNEKVMSWRIYLPPGKNNFQNSQHASSNNSNQVKSKLHSQDLYLDEMDEVDEMGNVDLAEINMKETVGGWFRIGIKSVASVMQTSLMRFGLGPSDAPVTHPKLRVPIPFPTRISTASVSSQKAGSLLLSSKDKNRLSLGFSLPMPLRMKMAKDCCMGVAFLHSKGLMHCDIKSLNFLVSKDFTVKLADLGEARSFVGIKPDDLGQLPKNINWTAPEILINNDNPVCELADVWSLAIVMAEILTGEIPFDSQSYRTMTVEQFVDSLAQNLRPTIPNEVDDWLKDLITKGWSYNTSHRCSAEEMMITFNQHFSTS